MISISSGVRRLERDCGFIMLLGLLGFAVSGACMTSYAGDRFLPPPSVSSSFTAQQELSSYFPVYHIPLRVHLGSSARPAAEFGDILEEINHIWLSQAGICFEMQVVMNDDVQSSGFDIWFMPRINNSDFVNGIFAGGHSIYVRDTPVLNAAPRPARHPAARTAAHELGHALGLPHRQDSEDNLMRSKAYGWQLNRQEVDVARKAAVSRAIRHDVSSACRPARVTQ